MQDDRYRQALAEAAATRQVLEAQRDDALTRAARAEDSLSLALR